MQTAQSKAAILVEALPYIRAFAGKTIVIKYGGNAMTGDDITTQVMADIALMKYVGIRPVIVHGGGPDITAQLEKVGKQSEFIGGLRITDAETAAIAEMVLVGKINSAIVDGLNRHGVRAVGLSGKDAHCIRARKKSGTLYENGQTRSVDLGYVGSIAHIDTTLIEDLLARDYIPVVAPIGCGEAGETYNINADTVAAELAGALAAEKLLLLTNVEGIYRDINDPASFISVLRADEARAWIADGTISGGMIPKVEACLSALAHGAHKAHIIDGRLAHAIILELYTSAGIGTQLEN